MTPLAIWQETAGQETAGQDSTPTDQEIIRALRAIWQDAEAEIDICQAELSHPDDLFPAARRLDDAIVRCEATEAHYTRAWSAFCAARSKNRKEAA